MYRRFRLLYHRYATRHLHLSLGTGVVLRAGRIVLEGNGPSRLEHGATGVEGAAGSDRDVPQPCISMTDSRSSDNGQVQAQ